MDRWDVVQSATEPEDSSWIENLADRVLTDPEAKEQFLQETLSPVANVSRNLRNLISGARNANVKEISRTLRWLIAWPPGSVVKIGDVGSFASGVSFLPQTQLSALGIDVNVRSANTVKDIQQTYGEVSVTAGDQVTRIEFGQPGATFFAASDLRTHKVGDYPRLARDVAARADEGEWSRDWYIVTQIEEAALAMLLVAKGAGAYVEFRGGDFSSGKLGRSDRPPVISGKDGMQLVSVSGPGSVPLFRLMELGGGRSPRMTRVETFDDI